MEEKSRKPNRLKDFDYSANGYYFITICTAEKRKILCNIVGVAKNKVIQNPCYKGIT